MDIFRFLGSHKFYGNLAKSDNRAIPIIYKDELYPIKIDILNEILWKIGDDGIFDLELKKN